MTVLSRERVIVQDLDQGQNREDVDRILRDSDEAVCRELGRILDAVRVPMDSDEAHQRGAGGAALVGASILS